MQACWVHPGKQMPTETLPKPVKIADPSPRRDDACLRPHPVTNSVIAQLFSRESRNASYFLQKAMRRAARSALLWPVEAASLWLAGTPLSTLKGIGPHLAKTLASWFDSPPPLPAPEPEEEDFLTMAQAKEILTRNPAWSALLKGDLQMHTTWSDGTGSVAEMGTAAGKPGYEYIAITDHSKGLKIAGGIDEEALGRQGQEIAAFNQTQAASGSSLRILRSIEMNLNPAGAGDMDQAALRKLDLVLGSFHSALRRKDDQTERYLAAIRNPDVHVLGHPRGRIYNFRPGLSADWPRVFAEAARLDKAVEIDCFPDRQDLNVSLLKIARKEGCRISIGTDAHHPWQLEFIDLGLAAALLAKIPPARIMNFMPQSHLLEWVESFSK
jgi:histidinol phosphatase-like PHP family hydrolase